MRQLLALLTLGLLATSAPAGDPTATISARLNTPAISVLGGHVFLHLTVTTPRFNDRRREPLNLSVVLDRSGSMADERKMVFARQAIHRLIDALDEKDIFSLVVYDDRIDVLRAPAPAGSKRGLHALVDGIEPRGSTDLGGGMMEGFRMARQYVRRGYVNRVILLSDGLANQGITNPQELDRIARIARRDGITLTTMGVGLDYNENLMVGLAEHGGGNYYFIEAPSQLAHILQQELDYTASIVCRESVIHLKLGTGVRLKDVIGYEWKQEDDGCAIELGDLAGGEERELTVELDAPGGTGKQTIAAGNLKFQSDRVQQPDRGFETTAEYVKDERVVEAKRDLEVQGKADVAVSTRRVEKALEALDRGESEDAAAEISAARAVLQNSPAASSAGAGGAALRNQMSRLSSFQDSVQAGDARKAKKAIQYENYRQQKNKQ